MLRTLSTHTLASGRIPVVSGLGDPLEGVPEYSYSLTADYSFNWGSAPGFFRLDYNKQGSNSLILRGQGLLPETDESEPLIFLNARLGVQWEYLSVELFGNNLLDDTDIVFSSSLLGTSAQARRRSLGIKLDYDF